MDYQFNDRPQEERLALMAQAYPDANPEVVSTFLQLQWTYREMQRQYDAVLARSGLSESRFIILIFLSHADNHQLAPSAIADKLGATRATVTKMVKGMRDNGWVQQVGNLADKRSTLIQMTDAGQACLDGFLPDNFQSVNTLLGGLTSQERATLRVLLDKVSIGTQQLKNEMERNSHE